MIEESNEGIQKNAVALLEEIRRLKTQAEDHLRAVEATRKKADDDATYAFQAKNNCEEHAKAAAVLKGSAEADVNSIAANKKNFDELFATVTVNKVSLDAEITGIFEGRKETKQAMSEVSKVSRVIKERAAQIETAKATVDGAVQTAGRLLETATESQKNIEAAAKKVSVIEAQVEAVAAGLETIKTEATATQGEIGDVLARAVVEEVSLKEIIGRLTKSHEISASHEKRVAELTAQIEELKNRVEGLLPGATSAGLASAFQTQANRFSATQGRWFQMFFGCIVALVLVAAPSFFSAFGTASKQWEEILRGFALRLPIVVPLVWLAIYAGRNYMLSLRLEEDYAYKEAISRAFEGYKREMQQIEQSDAANPTPLNTLCANALKAIAERPGRIYEGKSEDISPLSETIKALQRVNELRKTEIANH
jgi:hypothetical protein